MNSSLQPPVPRRTDWVPIQCAILLLLASVSIYNFVRRDATAFEFPAIDMGCFFERQQDASFLTGDYFTNSLSQPNPRFVFGFFVLGVAKLLGTDWYGAYFALRCTLTVAMPMLWYLALWGMIRDRLTRERAELMVRLALGAAILLVMRRDVNGWFSIAWWPPFFIYVAAHPLAMAVGLLAIVLRTSQRHGAYWFSFLAWFCASLLHPSIGLSLLVFYWLWAFQWNRWRELLMDVACGALLPFGLLLILFRSPARLPAAEFIDYYAHVAHPFHYQVSQFPSLTSFPWWISFGLILALLSLGASVAVKLGDRRLVWVAVAFALAYAGCVAVQYLATEVWLSKAIAILGPSRFSCLGFYMVALVGASLLGSIWPDRFAAVAFWERFAERIGWLRPIHVAAVGTVAVIAMHVLLRDDLQGDIRDCHAGFYDWVERSTDPDDVFLPPFDTPLLRELPIIGRRAVYASQAFPFREDALREHVRRLTLGYGEVEQVDQIEGNDRLLRRLAYFRRLGPAHVLRAAEEFRLDYAVVEASYRGPFEGHAPCYADASVAVYAIESLRSPPYAKPREPSIAEGAACGL